MNDAQREALANANAHLNNAGLATVDDLVAGLHSACRLLRIAGYAMTGTATGRMLDALARSAPVDDEEFNAHAQLLSLADRVARLNRNAGEIGAGMLASLVDDARAIVGTPK